MGSVSEDFNNALCESFFDTVECEVLDRRRFPTQAEALMACRSTAGAAKPHPVFPWGASLSLSW